MKVRALTVLLSCFAATQLTTAQEPALDCAVTTAVEADLPPSVRDLPSPGGRLWYISPDRALWVRQPTTPVPRSDGAKFRLLWTRPDPNTPLVVTARRTDGATPQIRAQISTSVGPYVASELVFPTAGCWELAAAADDHRLAFVIKVEPPLPPTERIQR